MGENVNVVRNKANGERRWLVNLFALVYGKDDERIIKPTLVQHDFIILGHVLTYVERHSFSELLNEDPNKYLLM